ncbi:hypothetical protein AMET1_0134 [Methanonatronarchaeum thermophilum]|uniref:Uncharacterized protein n=1 Tax=Methanonatronarchaeum thermophilum TaxID=1927129 RepID=A0A1Y3GGY8_9EURY|nr:hypothetical protein [Methanonatronarchaeum thermophilum]OUJ19464.1 hypothetical protein AMET1_0134 [Methanonatronarchaeum thermophilum]
MSDFDVNPKKLVVFKLGSKYVFKQYFDQKEIFSKLGDYYNQSKYRFEFTEPDKDHVFDTLNEHYYRPQITHELTPYCVGKERYTKHASILKNSVSQRMIQDYNIFLMKDSFSVEKAIQDGATPVKELEIERTTDEICDPKKWK